jgi:hypothetical protein
VAVSLRRAQLRAAVDAVIATPPSDERRDADPAVVAALDTPFENVSEVRRRLDALTDRFAAAGDRRAVFAAVYARMTRRTGKALADGYFNDPDWVRRYLVDFAERYRRAALAFERGAWTPPAWRVAFGAATGDDTLVVQDALCGIVAHVVFDLAFTLRGVGVSPNRTAKRRDHDRVNDLLDSLVDDVQSSLSTRFRAAGLADADRLLGNFDEAATTLGLRESRAFAWRSGVALADGGRLRCASTRWWIGVVATGAVLSVLAPTVDPRLQRRLAALERDLSLLSLVETLRVDA